MKKDTNLVTVLQDDGVNDIDKSHFQNLTSINLDNIKKYFGSDSWASRVVYNDRFGGVLISQMPGEGNRLHYHADAEECWFIIEGEWEWFIEGEGTMKVSKGSIINVKRNTKHKIKCIGDKPGIRFAITKPDVEHIYEDE